MSKRLIKFGFVLLIVVLGTAQLDAQIYYAVADGNWSDPNTWSSAKLGTPGTGAGNGFPEAGSTAFTDGFEVLVDQDVTVANLGIRSTNRPPREFQLGWNGLFDPFTVTITGALRGFNNNATSGQSPTESVIEDTALLVFIFTSTASAGAIRNWSYLAPFNTVYINPTTGTVQTANATGGTLAISESLIVQSGTFRPRRNLADASGGAFIEVDPGATLSLNGANVTGDGTLGTKFNNIIINGAVSITASNSLSTENFSIGPTGTMRVTFVGNDQTQGWWYQTTAPSLISIDELSTVSYNGNAAQNVYGAAYGNLTLSNSSKTLVGGSLALQGNLAVNNGVTFSPTALVSFIGTGAQGVSGGGTLNFVGGLEVIKPSGTLTFRKPLSVTNGLNVLSGTLSLGNNTTTLNTGDFVTDGTTISGNGGTLLVTGTSTFSGTGSLTLRNLTTQLTTGVATVNNDSWSITGSIVNNGTITLPSTSTVTFGGGAAQSISGNAFTVGNMVVNKTSSTLSNNGSVTLLGALTMTTGTFDADGAGSGNFILNSDTNGDARIGPMAGGSIIGDVTFQRYYNNTVIPQASQWRNFAFPVTGVDYSVVAGSLSLLPNSLATYTESVTGDVDQGWVFPTGTLNSKLGHTAWMYSAAPTTLSVKGPLLNTVPNTYNYDVTFTPNGDASADGWNFIPNPYASPINWNSASGWVKTNVGGVAVIWDQVGQTYQTAGVIAQGQGFWVQAAAGPLLTSTEAVKTTDSDPLFYRESNVERSKLFISLKSGRFEDVTTIQFRKDATEEHDLPFDAYKLKNGIYNLSSLTKGGANLMVNVLPESRCGSSIKLNITNIDPGTYSMNFDGLESFDNLKSITLIDNFGRKEQVIAPDEIYSFEVTSAPESYGSERFVVQFEFTDQTPNPVISKEGNRLTSSSLEGNQWYMNDTAIEGATGRSFVPSVHGEYHVRVKDGRCDLRSEVIPIIDGMNRIFPNPASEWLKVDVYHLVEEGLPGRILVHSTQGQLIRDESFTAKDSVKEIDILDVRPGSYIVTVVSGTGVILEKSKVVIK